MKKIITGILGVTLIALLIGLYMYNKPHKNMYRVAPDYVIKAKDFSTKYNTNEDTANKVFLGKVIQVDGVVLSDQISASKERIIVLEGDGLVNIQCALTPDNGNTSTFIKGEMVSIKGVCTGMLLDVVMNDCVIEKHE